MTRVKWAGAKWAPRKYDTETECRGCGSMTLMTFGSNKGNVELCRKCVANAHSAMKRHDGEMKAWRWGRPQGDGL